MESGHGGDEEEERLRAPSCRSMRRDDTAGGKQSERLKQETDTFIFRSERKYREKKATRKKEVSEAQINKQTRGEGSMTSRKAVVTQLQTS